ncbi:hypothetical protein AYK26_02825 [Euryarchaeota archaeon SM23-78]|nr:MAG: hypothetical protein AYK26_02825 [Euryarchaeota archaeon SM23-78]MBW3001312.1 hypothetical protein [Candidatus Woesearchaeota archaeon]
MEKILVIIIGAILIIIIYYLGYLLALRIKKKEHEQKKRVQVCPRCGSTKWQMSGLWTAPFGPPHHMCSECGYQGIFAEVDKEKKEDFKKKVRKK